MDDGINSNDESGKILLPASNCSVALQPFIKKLGEVMEK